MSIKTTKQAGFTLVEISLAMAIFTFMLLVVGLAYINIARLYSASTAARNVQQNNRFAMEQISRVARNSSSVTLSELTAEGGVNSLCFSSKTAKQKFYINGNQLLQGTVSPDCDSVAQNSKVLTSDNATIRLIKANTDVQGTLTLSMWMVSKVDLLDNLADGGLRCKSGAGSEFCAINKLTTTVELRGER